MDVKQQCLPEFILFFVPCFFEDAAEIFSGDVKSAFFAENPEKEVIRVGEHSRHSRHGDTGLGINHVSHDVTTRCEGERFPDFLLDKLCNNCSCALTTCGVSGYERVASQSPDTTEIGKNLNIVGKFSQRTRAVDYNLVENCRINVIEDIRREDCAENLQSPTIVGGTEFVNLKHTGFCATGRTNNFLGELFRTRRFLPKMCENGFQHKIICFFC